MCLLVASTGCSILTDLSVLGTVTDAGDAVAPTDGTIAGHDGAPEASKPSCAHFEDGSPHCFGTTCPTTAPCCASSASAFCSMSCTDTFLPCSAGSDCPTTHPVCCLYSDFMNNFGFDASACPIAIAQVTATSECDTTLAECQGHMVSGVLCGSDVDCPTGEQCEQAMLYGKAVGLCEP